MERDVVNRRYGFYSPVEVARHPVSRAEVELIVTAVREVEEARVLEKTPDNAHHPDSVAHARNSGPQAADAAHYEIDVHARLRRRI